MNGCLSPAKIDKGLEHLACGDALHVGQCVWVGVAQLEAGRFRFRGPLNQERRFIPRPLNDVPDKPRTGFPVGDFYGLTFKYEDT